MADDKRQNYQDEKMTVQEAGHKGGKSTSASHDRAFYEKIGHMGGEKGGQRVRELVQEGKEAVDNNNSKEED